MRADPYLGRRYARTAQFSRIVFTGYGLVYLTLFLWNIIGENPPSFAVDFPFLTTQARWVAALAVGATVLLALLLWTLPKRLKNLFALAMGLMAIFALLKFVSIGIGVLELLVLAVCQRGWAAARNEHFVAYRRTE